MKQENNAHRLAIDCIYEALIQLMKCKPFREISITDITKKAGVSRMAYYRNFTDKKEILINHMQERMNEAEERISSRQDLSKEELWRDLIDSMQKDPVMKYILDAGIMEETFYIHLNYMTHLYTKFYGTDPDDADTIIFIHRQMGSLFGCFLYMLNHSETMDRDKMIQNLIAIAKVEQ